MKWHLWYTGFCNFSVEARYCDYAETVSLQPARTQNSRRIELFCPWKPQLACADSVKQLYVHSDDQIKKSRSIAVHIDVCMFHHWSCLLYTPKLFNFIHILWFMLQGMRIYLHFLKISSDRLRHSKQTNIWAGLIYIKPHHTSVFVLLYILHKYRY